MSGWRRRVERGFHGFALWLVRWRWAVLAAMAGLALAAASGLTKLTIDTSNEAFLHKSDPILARYLGFKRQFGRDDVILVAVAADALFSAETLDRLKALHDDLAARVPHLADIVSLVNARDTRGEGDRLLVDDLLETWPETDAARAAAQARARANPLYRNRLLSADGRMTAVVLRLDAFAGTAPTELGAALAGFDETQTPPPPRRALSDADNRAAVDAVRAVVAAHQAPGFRLYVAGTPAVTEALKQALQHDMSLFMRLAVAVIAVCLLVMFRRASGVVLPLLVVALALLSTVGLMGHLGVPVKIPTVILPSFLLAVGVGASVHVLAMFYRAYDRGAEKHAAIAGALGHSGLAIVMTSLTTAAGLGSFATAEVAPVADLGRFASAGVLVALVYTVVLLPACLAAFPVRRRVGGTTAHAPALDRFYDRLAGWTTRNARAVVALTVAVTLAFLAAAAQLRFSHDVLSWLPEDWPVHRATRVVDEGMKGTVALEVVVDTGRENGLYDRATLLTLERLTHEIAAIDTRGVFVGKVTSVVDMLKEIHQALNGNDPAFYKVPDNPRLIPQEFLLFENSGSDDLEDVVDSGFRQARFTIRVPWRDTLAYVPLIREVEARFRAAFGERAEIGVTGVMSILSRTLNAAIHSAARSYVIAFAVITLMMIALIGRVGIGLVSMLPNLAPIVVAMGTMDLLGIPLNLFTMLVGSIAIGLAVDDTVHFMHHFHRFFAETGNVQEAVARTLHGSGRAMLVTSVVLALGFFVFCFSALINVAQFGFLTGLTIVLALLADYVVSPALMALCWRRAERTSALAPETGATP